LEHSFFDTDIKELAKDLVFNRQSESIKKSPILKEFDDIAEFI
jgi:hypothetical protein